MTTTDRQLRQAEYQPIGSLLFPQVRQFVKGVGIIE